MTQPQRRRDDESTGNGPRPLNERLAELRETAKRDPSFLYLLPGSMEPPRQKSRRKPVLFVAAAGALLALGAVAVLALGSGGGGSSGSVQPTRQATTARRRIRRIYHPAAVTCLGAVCMRARSRTDRQTSRICSRRNA